MFTRGRILIGNLNNLALLSLAVVFCLFPSTTAGAQTSLSASSVNFGNVGVSTTSSVQNVILRNTGSGSITLSSIAASPSIYVVSGSPATSCGASLSGGASCTIALTATPTALGAFPAGSLTVTSSAPNSPESISLGGTAVAAVTTSAASLAFGNVLVGQASVTQTLQLTNNNQSASITISSITPPAGGYALLTTGSKLCPTSGAFAAGATCNIPVALTPAALGTVPAGSIEISTSAGSPAVPLTGAGISLLNAASLAFGNAPVGSSSSAESILLTNAQGSALTINSITVPTGYVLGSATTCPNPTPPATGNVAPGGSCKISVAFAPTALGAAPASSLAVNSNLANGAQLVSLSGTGVPASGVSPATLAFGNEVVNQTSTIKTVTFSNYQSTSITFSSFAMNPGSEFSLDPSTTCSTTTPIAGGTSCKLAFTFTPTATGSQPNGTLTINDSAGNTGLTVTLTGTGLVPAALVPSSLAFGLVSVGSVSATSELTLENYQSAGMSISSLVFNGPFELDTTAAKTTCPVPGGAVSGPLAGASSCTIGIKFAPTATGATSGGLVTLIYPAGSISATLSGSGSGQPVTENHGALSFGNVGLGSTSATQSVTFTNTQSVSLNFTSIAAPAPFAVVPGFTTCVAGTPVLAHNSCVVVVDFAPTSLGYATQNLTLTDDASNSPQIVSLGGTGESPVAVSPSPLAFGTVVVSQQATKNLILTNYTSSPIVIDSITGLTGVYSLNATNSTCPSSPNTVAAGASCIIAVNLTAAATGSQPGSGSVTYNLQGSSTVTAVAFSMTGSAIQPVVFAPTQTLWSTPLLVGNSLAKTVTLYNEQNVPLNISGITLGGADPGDFTVSPVCPIVPVPVAANSNCALTVTFKPTASGTRNATMIVADDAPGSPQNYTLSGNANAPVQVSPASITSFAAAVGTTSVYRTVTITNEYSTPLSIASFQFTGPFIQTATTCGATPPYTLASTASCTVSLSFNPTIGGTTTGQLQVYDSAGTSPQVVNLSGVGNSPLTISPTSLAFSAQLLGTPSAPKLFTLTNHESQSETFTLTPSGDYSAVTGCTTGTIAANSSCQILVTFTPSSVTPATRTGSIVVTDSAPGGSPLTESLTGSATATNPGPAVSVVSPGASAACNSLNITITGNGWTHFSNTSVLSFVDQDSATYPADVTVNSVTASTANSIVANITLACGSVVYGARNLTVTTPLSGGGTEKATLQAAFIIADPNLTHTITTVTPAFGSQGQTETVALTATDTNFVQGVTFANFGDGITVDSLTVTSPTAANALITISNTTPIGYRAITIMTGGEIANSVLSTEGNPIFQIGPNSATLVSVTAVTPPPVGVTTISEPQSYAGPVYLTATGTHFLQSATTVSIGGVTVGDVLVTSPTTATAQVIVPATAPLGPENVTVATGGEIASLNNSFTITGSTPALISVVPSSAVQGTSVSVVITGNAFTAFNACPGGAILADFTGEISSPTVNILGANQVSIPITVAQDANVGSITANLTCGAAGSATIFPFTFTVTPSAAAITSVVPNSVPQGGQVTLNITAINTNWVQGTTQTTFYPASVPVPLVNETTINSPTTAMVPISVPVSTPPGTYGFYMATGGQIVSASINVYANTPTLTMSPANGLVPSAGNVNFPVTFTGQFTHFSQTGTVPVIAGEGVTLSPLVVNSLVGATANITIAAGAATGPRLVTFTTGSEIVTTYFNVTSTPVGIISISPYHAPQSDTLNVEIVGLNTHFAAGVTNVIFGGPQITVNSVTVNSPTDLIANVSTSYTPPGGALTPTPPGWNQVYVNTGAEQVITGFSVDAPLTPTILSVTPDSAAQGTTDTPVTITGSLTNWVQGQSELILGSGVTVANLQITSPTTATATLSVNPTAPVGGNSVIMITGPEYDSGTGFSVTPSAAYISAVGPNVTNCQANETFVAANACGVSGGVGDPIVVAQLQTTTLLVTGVGTHWLQGETTFSFGSGVVVDQLTINSPTSATVQITVLSSAPVGFATATAFTNGENASLQQAIDIEEGSPVMLAFSPGSGQQAGNYNVSVLGRFTNWPIGVNTVNAAFNQDITVNSVTVIDSETLTMNITVSPWAYVDGGPCGHVLTITSGSEQVSMAYPNPGVFCVTQGAEEITAVAPLSGIQGSTEVVTITGSDTNFVNGQTSVSFGDPNFNVGEITVVSPTVLTVPVAITTSASTGFKTITATTYGQVAQQVYSFTVTPGVAQLTEAIPDQLEQGAQEQTIRLIGEYSHFSSASTATFGAGIVVVGTPTYVSPTEIDAVINIDPLSYVGGRNVTVTTPNVSCADQPPLGANIQGVTYAGCTPGSPVGTGSEIVNANVFTIIQGPAIITSMSPNTGNEGSEIVATITGSATHWQQNFTQFYIAGAGSDITVNDVIINSPTSATVDFTLSQTATAGPRSIYMVTAGESLTDSGAFLVTGGVPAITYLSPSSAQPGTTELQVTINGNQYTQWCSATVNTPCASPTTVSFGPGITIDSYTVDDASHITADINIGPTCTSPGVPANCAQYGYRTVVAQTGSQGLNGNFDVVPPPPPPTPYVWSESPTTGIPGQTLSVNFYGANTEWNLDPVTGTQLTGWDSNNITVNSFQVTSATSAVASITINSAAPAEQMTLTLTTPNTASYGTEVDFGTFTIVISQPVLSIVDPGSGMQGAGLNGTEPILVNILGQFTAFDATTTFNFGSGITLNGPPTILGPTIATQSIIIGQETPTGGYAVTATTPDAPAIAKVVGGAGFSVTPSLALIASVTPNTAPQGTTITVDVTGSNTHWNGSTGFSFGDGIVVATTTVNSPTIATLTLVIPPLASEGTTSATATTSGEVARLNQAFVVTAGTPYLLSSGPGSIEQQGSAVFTILSQATTWSAATPPVVSYGPGVVLTNVNVTSPTSLTVDGYVQPTTTVGYRNLTVTTGTQTLGLNNAVYVNYGPAVINSVTPNTGGQGVNLPAVQINGINTNWVQGTTQLTFPGVLINSFVVNSPTSITANITVNTNATPGQVSVTATTLGEIATEVNAFNITQTQAELVFVNPATLPQGQTQNITLTGLYTSFGATTTVTVSNNVTVNSVTVNSATSLTANVTVAPTAALGSRLVTATTGAQVVSSSTLFAVTAGPAAILSLNPPTGGQGQSVTVTVTGSQTHFAAGTTTASFGGGINVTGIAVTDLLHASVTVSIPGGTSLGAYNVTLTTGGEVATILGGFTVTSGQPVLTVVNPPTGTQGTTDQNVTLTGQFTSFVNGTSMASFTCPGVSVNSTTVTNSTTAVANINITTTATLESCNVSVATGAQVASIAGGFTVLAGIPSVVSASPSMGQAGAPAINVVIDTQFTTLQQGFVSISFGSGITTNFYTVNSLSQVTANITISSNATVGARTISVTTGGQTLNLSNGFAVTAGTPVITQINPNIGTLGQSLTVTLTGQYTNWVNGTTTASFGPGIAVGGAADGVSGPVTVTNATTLTASIVISATATLGPNSVITSTGGEVENVPGGFTIQPVTPPSPAVISLSPGPNVGGMPLNSQIIAVFSEPMLRSTITTTTVTLQLTSNPGGSVQVAGSVNLDATGRVLTFTPNTLLAVNSTFYFNINSSVQSATGVSLSNYAEYLYTTAASAITSPTVIAANPPALSTTGTNVVVALEFSADMNQSTQTGMTVSTGGSPIAGTYSWNSDANCCSWGPGTILTFTPAADLTPGATYTVAWTSAMTDTADNAATPGSFTFTAGAAPDTVTNTVGAYWNGETNVPTNFAPVINFAKPINPIDINTGTLLMYNADSGKYIAGTVSVAANGLSATFTPSIPMLPDSYYRVYQAGGYYDYDANYLNGNNFYFTTGVSEDTTPPTVSFVTPPSGSTSIPLNTQIVVRFSTPVNDNNLNVITVTPSSGPAIPGSVSLASDDVTLTFVPTTSLTPGTVYTTEVSGFTDLAGNVGTTASASFTTSASGLAINVSTGISSAGTLITTSGTPDPHWSVVLTGIPSGPTSDEAIGLAAATTSTTPPCLQTSGVCNAPQPLLITAPGDTGFYSGWSANGPNSSWIDIVPQSTTGNTFGVYSTTFNIPGPTVPSGLCLVGNMGVDDNGKLAINGNLITGSYSASYVLSNASADVNATISNYLVVGSNTLSLVWGSTDNSDEAFRLQAVIQTCGASAAGGLTMLSSTPAKNATAVATNTPITMVFNNSIDPGTVNANTLPVMITWNSNQGIAGNYVSSTTTVPNDTVTFTPDSPFPVSTEIYVGNCNGPYDVAGDNLNPGCYGIQWVYFTTAATASGPAPPAFQVTAFTPSANATNVGLRAPVVATFNRSVSPGSVNSQDFGLFAGDGQSPWCTSYSRSQDNATFAFTCYALPSSTPMTAILNSGIRDWGGDSLANFTSSFTTGQYDSNTNGTIISTRPGNGASGVNGNLPIVLYSNLPINPGTASNGIEVAQNNALVPGSVQILDGGYTLEFTPSTPFVAGALIQWWITGTLADTTYNTPINQGTTSAYFYVAASTSTLKPTIQTTSLPDGTNPAPLNAIFDTQFNTPINPSTITAAGIYLYDGNTGMDVPVTYSQPQPNEVLMVPQSTLPVNHTIYVEITTSLQSTTSVPATATYWYVYTGTAKDSTLPTIVSAVPYNGAANVGVNVSPGVVLSKPVDPVSLNSSTFQVLNGVTPLAGSYWFSTNDERIEFVPNAPLPASTTLSMKINGVTDAVGNPITYNSTFQTAPGPDFISPAVTWASASNNDSVPLNTVFTVDFSESMDVTTFTAGQPGSCQNFHIYDYTTGDCIATTLTWNSTQTVAYLLPTVPLAAGRQYNFYIASGTDLAGNTMSSYSVTVYGDFTGSFTAPTVVNFNPIDGKTGLGTNAVIEAQFSAPIDPTSITGVTLTAGGPSIPVTPVMSAGNTVLQLVPAAPLSPGVTYTMTIAGVTDPAGNTVATVTNSFTTGTTYDITAATAINSEPAGSSTVGTNLADLKIVFNKPLNPITVNPSTFRMLVDDTGQVVPVDVTLSADGFTAILAPQFPLLPNTEYYFQACCGFQDEDGNNGNEINIFFYTSGGSDTTDPTVTVTPVPGATAIPLNAQVVATLSVPMDPTSWGQTSIQLLNGSTPVAGTVSYTNSTTLTFVPSANLAAGTTYTINVNNLTDANGNPVVPYTNSFTTGTVAGTGGLTVVSTNITNGNTVSNASQPIIVTFSEPLDPSTVNSTTLRVMVGWNSLQGIAGTYTVNGAQVTFTPSVPYPTGSTIYMGECGGPTDVLGDVFQSGNCWSDQIAWFTIGAGGAPAPFQVISVSPGVGATNVGRDQSVSVTFNHSINQGSANNYNSQLYAGQDLQTNGSYTLSADNRTLTFSIGALYAGTTYTIAFPAGGISDQSGNTLVAPFTSTFTTLNDTTTGASSVIGTSPSTNATGVPTDSLLTFYLNRPVDASTLANNVTVAVNGQVYAGAVTSAAGGYEVQYTPTAPFPAGATVQWWFSASVLDTYGNVFNADNATFYIAAAINPTTAAPTVVAVSPACCNSSNMPTNGEIDIQYSLPLNAATVNTTNFYENAGPAAAYTVALISPTVVRISPPSGGWNASYSYYGFCSKASVQGTNGVNAASSCWLTYFDTTAGPDMTSGTVTVGPPDGSQNVGTNAYIRLQFSKPADRTTVNSNTVQVTTGGNPIPGTFTYNYSGEDLVGANFLPVNPLPPSANIQVVISNILDYAGNQFSQPSITFATAATPVYYAPQVTLDFSGGATGIATNASFTCRYSRPMDPSSITPGNTYLYSYVTNAVVPVNYAFSADMMSVTMTPQTQPLLQNSEYDYYCNNAIDLTGNAQSNSSSYFYTGSGPVTTGPVLVYANPPNGMTNVPVNTNNGPWNGTSLGLLFNEPVAADSLGSITLTPQGGSPIPIANFIQDGNYIVSVQLPYALQAGTLYTFNVTGVTDLNGNAMTPVTSTFTTGTAFDFNNPTVTTAVPANGATNVAIPSTLSITFSEAMDPVIISSGQVYLRTHNTQTTVPTTFSISTDYKTVILTPVAPLQPNTLYDILYYPNSWYLTGISGYPSYSYGVESTFTTGTGVVNGACGSANGGSFTTAPPVSTLCSAGTVSGQTNVSGAYSWMCGSTDTGTSAACSATITPTTSCLAPPSGLVSWWPGNDNPNDLVGGNNGTIENGVGYTIGEVDDAFNFTTNTTSSSNQYVLVGQPVPTNLQIQNAISLSAWVYVTQYPANYGSGALGFIMGSQHDGTTSGATIFYDGDTNSQGLSGIPPGHIQFQIGNGSWHEYDSTTQVPLNQWVLITATRVANGPGLIYYNGVSQPTVTSESAWNGTITYTGSWFALGQQNDYDRPFDGLIDEAQIYDVALTPAQVQSIYSAAASGLCP